MLTYNQIIRQLEKELGFEKDAIMLNSQLKSDFTDDINLALDEVVATILPASGTWKYDDPNHPDYPIIQTNLNSGQRDYTFTTDEQGNLILDIYKVLIADQNGVFSVLTPTDVETRGYNTRSFTDGNNTTGQPTKYDKMANGFFLDVVPDYSITNGIKVYYSRAATHFTTSDTTKVPGFNGLFHEFLVLSPAYRYARANTLNSVGRLERDVEKMRKAIASSYSRRKKDEATRMIPSSRNTR